MAKGAITVKIDGKYDDKDLNRAIKDLQALKTQSGALASPMQSLGKAALAAGAGFASFAILGKVADFMGDAAQAAMDEEKSVRALAQAFDNLGLSAQLPMAERGIAQLSKMAAVADDDLRPALQTLVTATGSVEKSQALLETALNASAATGRSLESIVLGIAKASTGQVAALRKLGVPLDDNIVKTKDFGAAIDVMNAKFGGQAAAAAQTYAGQMKGIGIAADEAKEVIGGELLEAISEVSTAFGGTGGATNVIEGFGETVGNVIEVFGTLAAGIAALVAQQEQGTDSGRNFGDVLTGYATWVGAAVPPLGALANAFSMVNDAGEVLQDSEAALKAQMDGLREAGGAGDAQMRRYALGIGAAAKEAYNADAAMEALKDAVKEFQDAISLSQSMDDFREDLRNIGADLKDSATTIFGPAGKDVRDKAREIFGQIPTIVQQMVDQGKIAQGDFQSTVDSMARQALTSFAKNKVKRQDLENWLGEQGIWSDPAKARAKQVAIDAAAAATKAGQDLGADLARGIPVGLLSQTKPVQAAGMRLIAQAEAAMRLAAESQSPSKLTARVGEDLSKGVAVGVLAATGAVTDASRQMIRDAIDAAKSERDAAMAAMRGVSDSIVGQVLGNVGFSTTDAEGNALTPQQIVASILGSTANQQAAVTAIATNIGAKLPPELLAKILQMPPETAVALANYLGGAEGSAMLAQLTTNYATLATETETLLGGPMGLAWGKVGDQSARDMLIAARATIAELAPGFANFVRSQLSVGADVVASITGVAEGIAGKRAAGGPVTPGNWLVGEKGPEIVSIGASGYVTPNHALGSRGGNTYAVSVYVAPGGDLAGAGRQMVEAIRAYERSSGKVYAAA